MATYGSTLVYGTLDGLASELACVKQPWAVISSEDFEYCVQYPDKLVRFEAIVQKSGWDPSYIAFCVRTLKEAHCMWNLGRMV